jgi:hypothetical protein
LALTSLEDVGRRFSSEKYHILRVQQEKCNRCYSRDFHFSHQNLGRSRPRCRPQAEVHFTRPYAQPLLCVNGMAVVCPGNAQGEGLIHKSKMNSNGSFSVGKTWKLNELRGVEVTDVSCTFVSWIHCALTPTQPLTFNVTLARTYRWQTEQASEQVEFLHVLVDLFRSVSGGTLQVIGLAELGPGIRSGEMHFLFVWLSLTTLSRTFARRGRPFS